MFGRMALAAAAAVLVLAGSLRADIIVSIGSGTVAPGGTGTVDVFLSSTTPLTPDRLSSFVAQFQITEVTGPGFLRFTPAQPNPFADSRYVFFGNSFDQHNGLPLFTVSTTTTPNDTAVGVDNTFDGSSVPLSHPFLLGTLRFTADQALPAGDTFAISLNPTASTFLNGLTPIPFSANVGLVEVVVPEPGTLALLAAGVAALGLARRAAGIPLSQRRGVAPHATSSGRAPAR
jgi:hypothetical protein